MNRTTASAIDDRPAIVDGKFLCFRLAGQIYAVAVGRVREIIGMAPVTALPRTQGHVLGVVNRRGRIVPVIDLRRRLGMPPAPPTDEGCIVVVDVAGATDDSFVVGCVVDVVDEVTSIGENEFEPAPRCVDASTDYIAGLAIRGERLLILLDIDRVLADVDPAALCQEPTP